MRLPEAKGAAHSISSRKMFQLVERLSTFGAPPPEARRYLKRAFLFGAGLLLLWVALQLVPSAAPPVESAVYSDDAGTVAARAEPRPSARTPSLFTPGMLAAILLLGGGVAVAIHLRRRTNGGEGPTAISPVGEYAIGPNQSLRLIECAGEVLLIGVTAGQVSLLRSYPPDQFDLPPSDRAGVHAAHTHFADVLHRYAGQAGRIEQSETSC